MSYNYNYLLIYNNRYGKTETVNFVVVVVVVVVVARMFDGCRKEKKNT